MLAQKKIWAQNGNYYNKMNHCLDGNIVIAHLSRGNVDAIVDMEICPTVVDKEICPTVVDKEICPTLIGTSFFGSNGCRFCEKGWFWSFS